MSYLKSLNQVTLEYLVGEVCRSIINDTISLIYSQNLDIVDRLSKDLENEGIILSNEKIHTLVLALRPLIKVYYKLYTKMAEATPEPAAEINERVIYQLTMRTSLKEGIIQALVTTIETMLKEQLSALDTQEGMTTHEKCKHLFQQINLRQLISFDIALKHDICTEHCKQLKKTTAIMIFKIASPSPLTSSSREIPHGFTTKTIECSLDEVKMFREEILKI